MANASSPHLIVLAGPNGAGKSTAAPTLLQGALGVKNFVNADTIAQGLSAFDPQRAAFAAGRIMLARIQELAAQRSTFAFETTLASRTFAPWIGELVSTGYRFSLVFFWLSAPQIACQRVAERVRSGGHAIPEEVIVRRFHRGLQNFVGVYQPMANAWRVYDNSIAGPPRLIATRSRRDQAHVLCEPKWNAFQKMATR